MSNTIKRIIVGVIGILIILILIYLGGYYLFALTLLLQSLCFRELLKIFENKNIYPLKIVSVLISLILSVIVYFKIFYFIPFFVFSVVFLILIEIFRGEKRNPFNAALSIFGLLYITVPFIFLNEFGKNFYLILSIFILIWTCDTFAFFGGKLFGKHKLSDISPKKTVEGSVTGFIFTMITALILSRFSGSSLNLTDFVVLGIIAGAFSQAGDMFESMMKRYCDVKDSSNIIPGHGGVLDRFDSLIFILPFIYLYFNYIK